VSAVPSSEPIEVCPGCGAVLVQAADDGPGHPGASRSCGRLYEVTLRGLREEAAADAATAAVLRRADAAYDAQHPVTGDPVRLRGALDQLGVALDTPATDDALPPAPHEWRTTIADVAADLDVIDLAVLVDTWARAVHDDWRGATTGRR
jgi:hypothetical protein